MEESTQPKRRSCPTRSRPERSAGQSLVYGRETDRQSNPIGAPAVYVNQCYAQGSGTVRLVTAKTPPEPCAYNPLHNVARNIIRWGWLVVVHQTVLTGT